MVKTEEEAPTLWDMIEQTVSQDLRDGGGATDYEEFDCNGTSVATLIGSVLPTNGVPREGDGIPVILADSRYAENNPSGFSELMTHYGE